MKTKIIIALIFLSSLTSFANENTSNRIAVVVNQYLSHQITDSLNIYFQDLKNEGYEPILKEWSLEDNPRPKDLKEYLKNLYENGGLQGAVFIGDLPIAISKQTSPLSDHQGPFATDHYYMGLKDDEWKDTDGNEDNEKPLFTINNIGNRAIWVSRLTVGRNDWYEEFNEYLFGSIEPEIIRNYFKKNHEFRTGSKLYKERSWNYVIDEFLVDIRTGNYKEYISLNKASDFFLGDLAKPLFLKLLTEGSNELGQWIFHGGTDQVMVNNIDYIYSYEIDNLNLETAFLLPQSCWIGNYTAPDYFSGALLFSKNSGVQTLISVTMPTRLWPRDLFEYPFQEGQSFGNSYLSYLSSNKNWPNYLIFEEESRVILGDGTLKRQRYLIGSDKIEPGERTLRSPELRKEITPSYMMPLIMTLKFDFPSHTISWNRYYNEDYLSYRLGKIEANSNETVMYEGKDNSFIDNNLQSGDKYFLVYVWDEPGTGNFTSQKSAFNPNAKNENGYPNLASAINKGRLDIVDLLLKAGANPNTQLRNGYPVLALAIGQGRLDIVDLLLKAGANPNTQFKDGSPIISFTIDNGKTDIVDLLLKAGANHNTKDKNGWSPLKYAIRANSPDSVALLIIHGANVSTADVDFALANGNNYIAKLLTEVLDTKDGKKEEL